MVSTTSTTPDDPWMIHDFYVMAIDRLKKASFVWERKILKFLKYATMNEWEENT